MSDRCVEGLEDFGGLGCKGGALGGQDALLAIDGSEYGYAAAALVCSGKLGQSMYSSS